MHDLIHLHNPTHPLQLEIYYSLEQFFNYRKSLTSIIDKLPSAQRDTPNTLLLASLEGMDQAEILDSFRGMYFTSLYFNQIIKIFILSEFGATIEKRRKRYAARIEEPNSHQQKVKFWSYHISLMTRYIFTRVYKYNINI